MAYDYKFLDVAVQGRLATVTISNPPMNLITPDLYAELTALSLELKADDSLTVVVFKSADPDFFLAHYDVEAILKYPIDKPAQQEPETGSGAVRAENGDAPSPGRQVRHR